MLSQENQFNMSQPAWRSACHDLVEIEIGRLIQEHVYVMAEDKNYVVLRAMADQIPHTLYEIGRLRELTAMTQGDESAGRIVDLDHFDLYYIHMVVWNKNRREVAGACRLGQMDIILKRFGPGGLYTGRAFRYSPLFQQETGPALEIGKIFIRPEYSRRYTPVSVLWKGIGHFLSYNPRYRILVSLLSMSKRYSPLSRRIVMSYLKKNNFAPKAARLIEPVVSEPHKKSGGRANVVKTRLKDLKALTSLISELERDGKGIPNDLRHFVKVGGKLIGFGGHPSSKDVYCGLVLVDVAKCGRTVLNRCMGRAGVERFFDYHGSKEDRAA